MPINNAIENITCIRTILDNNISNHLQILQTPENKASVSWPLRREGVSLNQTVEKREESGQCQHLDNQSNTDCSHTPRFIQDCYL